LGGEELIVPFEDTPYNAPKKHELLTADAIESAAQPQYVHDAEAARKAELLDIFDENGPDNSVSFWSNEAATHATPGRMEVEIESQPEAAEVAPYGLSQIQNAGKNLVHSARPLLRRDYTLGA
jgi:hypothetical protein